MRPCSLAVTKSLLSFPRCISPTDLIHRKQRLLPQKQALGLSRCMAASRQLHEFRLKQTEQELFDVLRGAAKHAELKTVMRCAGGWVRDKLLGKDSVDIDIALDDLLGTEFAKHLNTYLELQGKVAGRIAIVPANSDKSKHLETAKIKINELDIDLVNLRSETYVSDAAHRIPQMTFGTAEQDAFRRDFTFNSMFYNINSEVVEDFTGMGKKDLQEGIVRTPLQAKETFMDDPLRVLRAVRFAARFGFTLESSLQDAAADKEVREALTKKVSRERVGAELEGMFNGPAPLQAMDLIHKLCLSSAVFTPTPDVASKLPSDWGHQCVQTLEACIATLESPTYEHKPSKEDIKTAHLAALLLPLRACQSQAKKGKTNPTVSLIIADSMKWKKMYAGHVTELHAQAPVLLEVSQQLQALNGTWEESASEKLRVKLGLAVRQLKDLWKVGILLASLVPLPSARPLGVDSAISDSSESSSSSPDQQSGHPDQEAAVVARVTRCHQLERAVAVFKLDKCWQEAGWRPLLDGQHIMKATGIKGPQMKQVTEKLMHWQLAHPDATKSDAEAYLTTIQG